MAVTTGIEWFSPKALGRMLDPPVGIVRAMLFGNLVRRRRASRLRAQVTALTPSRQAELLMPLRQEFGDTGQLARTVIRELRLTEPAPAAAPEGHGDEPTPAEPSNGHIREAWQPPEFRIWSRLDAADYTVEALIRAGPQSIYGVFDTRPTESRQQRAGRLEIEPPFMTLPFRKGRTTGTRRRRILRVGLPHA